MKNRIFWSGILLLLLIELTALLLFALPGKERQQDTIAVNEVMQTVQRDWSFLETHVNPTALAYVVLDRSGNLLYRTGPGLSETMNAAVRHKDTILTVEENGQIKGRLIIYNNDPLVFQAEKQAAVAVILAAVLLQGCLCAGYFFYLRRTILQPFHRLKGFAERIAGGNLDIPLEMDRQNLFGAFTESFDLMRSELKKARIAEAKANADKKELVAKLSHDIKTPVASIKAASEVGAALASDPKTRESYEQITQKADQINTLVTNLFSASLEELQELSVTPSDLTSGELQGLLANADYLHRAVIPPIPPCLLFADRLRLQQVFDNIFANSYKYAGTGIDVTAFTEGGFLNVCIEDHGGGVHGAELPLLKEKFRRGSNTETIDGAGLGLYISDYCMKKMQGQLTVENGGDGLKVTVRIAFSRAV